MKKIAIISTLILTTVVVLVSCDSKRQPGKVYMPDMAYSRAYETYAYRDTAMFTMDQAQRGHLIFYNAMPPHGTMKRGELAPYTVPNDTTLRAQINDTKNPLGALSVSDSSEAARLFNINCAICHGAKGGNDGPLAPKIGGVKSIIAAAPGYSDGKIFHIMTYGQGNMGSYASQLDRKQRWMLVQYIRTLVPKPEGAAAAATTAAATPAVTDTAMKATVKK